MPSAPLTSFLRQTGPSLCWLRIAFTIYASALPFCAKAQTPAEELRTAAAVRSLTAQEAQQQRRVRLRGVVTFSNEGFFSHFVQDETAGIYLTTSTNLPALVPGQLVEVEGVTGAGEFAPVVIPRGVKVLGEAPLPAAQLASIEELMGGQKDSQFIEVRGIVRSVQLQEATQFYLIEVANGGGRLSVYARTCRWRGPRNCWTAPCAPGRLLDEMQSAASTVRGSAHGAAAG